MNRKDLLKAASESHPELIEKVAHAINLSEQLDPNFGAEVAENIKDILDYTLEKVSSAGAWQSTMMHEPGMGAMKRFAIGAAGSAAAGLLGSLSVDLYDAAKRGLTKSTNYKRIMQAHPNLVNEVENPEKLKAHFDTLHRYAPEFTTDPTLGGAVLKQMANLPPGAESNFVSNLIGARSNLINLKHRQYAPEPVVGRLLVPEHHESKLLTETEKLKSHEYQADLARREKFEREKAQKTHQMALALEKAKADARDSAAMKLEQFRTYAQKIDASTIQEVKRQIKQIEELQR